jgi:hypothetical protein
MFGNQPAAPAPAFRQARALMKKSSLLVLSSAAVCLGSPGAVRADEQLFGYVKGAETLPKGAMELYQWATVRTDKGSGHYTAIDWKTEFEYGVSDRFAASIAAKSISLDTHGLVIDGYLPGDKEFTYRFSGVEAGIKYNYLSPAKDPIGLAQVVSFDFDTIDPHSGRNKTTASLEVGLLAQKYFLESRLVWAGNVGFEGTYAKRDSIPNLPPGFDWPTEPEMEIEFKFGTGLSYRFMRNFSIAAEALYETEFETEVGQERWTWFAGPSLHYGSKHWWATVTYLHQLAGGGEFYAGQPDTDYHLIEKTKAEIRVKVGFNF